MFSLSAISSLFLFSSSLLLLSATPALANGDLDRRSTPHDNGDVLAEVLKRAFAEATTSAAEELQKRSWNDGGEWLSKREASDAAIANAEELESRDWAGLDLAERALSDPDTADVLTARDLDDLFVRDYHAHLLRSRQLFGAGKAKAGAAGAGAAAAGGKAAKLKALIDKLKAAKAAKAAAAAGAAGAASAAGAGVAGAAGAADAAVAATTTSTAAAAPAIVAAAATTTTATNVAAAAATTSPAADAVAAVDTAATDAALAAADTNAGAVAAVATPVANAAAAAPSVASAATEADVANAETLEAKGWAGTGLTERDLSDPVFTRDLLTHLQSRHTTLAARFQGKSAELRAFVARVKARSRFVEEE